MLQKRALYFYNGLIAFRLGLFLQIHPITHDLIFLTTEFWFLVGLTTVLFFQVCFVKTPLILALRPEDYPLQR